MGTEIDRSIYSNQLWDTTLWILPPHLAKLHHTDTLLKVHYNPREFFSGTPIFDHILPTSKNHINAMGINQKHRRHFLWSPVLLKSCESGQQALGDQDLELSSATSKTKTQRWSHMDHDTIQGNRCLHGMISAGAHHILRNTILFLEGFPWTYHVPWMIYCIAIHWWVWPKRMQMSIPGHLPPVFDTVYLYEWLFSVHSFYLVFCLERRKCL